MYELIAYDTMLKQHNVNFHLCCSYNIFTSNGNTLIHTKVKCFVIYIVFLLRIIVYTTNKIAKILNKPISFITLSDTNFKITINVGIVVLRFLCSCFLR